MSYNATVLRKSIKPRPSPRPRCTMLPSPTVVDEVDANRSASDPLQPAPAPKTMSPWGRMTLHAAIDRSKRPRYKVSPVAAQTRRRDRTQQRSSEAMPPYRVWR
jgi:hypothetical protein